MKLLKFAVLLVAAFVAAHAWSDLSFATQKPAEPETVMLFARQAGDPLHIVQASFGADNSLIDALLENTTHQKIQSFRLNWAVVKKDDARLAKGVAVDVPSSVDSSASFTVPGPENAAKEDIARHPAGIVFYVAELQFSDGKTWQADPKKVRKEAIDMLK